MFNSPFLSIFCSFISINFFVEFSGFLDSEVVAQIKTILLTHIFYVLNTTQTHFNIINKLLYFLTYISIIIISKDPSPFVMIYRLSMRLYDGSWVGLILVLILQNPVTGKCYWMKSIGLIVNFNVFVVFFDLIIEMVVILIFLVEIIFHHCSIFQYFIYFISIC